MMSDNETYDAIVSTTESPSYDPAEVRRMFALMREHDLWLCPALLHTECWSAGKGPEKAMQRLGWTPMEAVDAAVAAIAKAEGGQPPKAKEACLKCGHKYTSNEIYYDGTRWCPVCWQRRRAQP